MTLAHHFRHLFLPHHSNNQRAKLLHPSSLVVILCSVLVLQIILRITSASAPQILGYASDIPASQVIKLTNIERQNRGLPLLNTDSQLSLAALQKAQDMFASNYWAHVSQAGTTPWSFITKNGYSYRYAGENLARDFTTPESVVKAWIDSPSHKENLLSNRYQDIGVAVLDGQLNGRETTLVVQMFGTKLSSKPISAKNRTPVVNVRGAQDISSPQLFSLFPKFFVNRNFSLALFGLLALILILDLIFVHTKALTRWTGKSLAHLIFIVALIAAVATVVGGQIL